MTNIQIRANPFYFEENINESSLEDFIKFAKEYNIFQISQSSHYDDICNQIKARLDREGLDYEIVRPE